MTNQYVIDASVGSPSEGVFCFCPLEGDLHGEFTVVTGLSYISDAPPEGAELVGIVHRGGQEAVEAFCQEHKDELDELKRLLEERQP